MPEQPTRENYFIILEIDPDKAWSDADFQKQLTVKQAEWSRGFNPTKKLRFQGYLDSMSQIKMVMNDPAQRAAEAAAAKQILVEREGEGKKELETQINLFAAKGYILDAEVESLVRDFKGRLSETVVRDEVRKRKLPNSDPKAPSPSGIAPLDKSTMDDISRNLEVLGDKDLYAFLGNHSSPPVSGLGRATSIVQLTALAVRIEEANRKIAITDARLTASNTLASLAKKVFATDEMQKRYHFALDNTNVVIFETMIKKTGATTKNIPARQFDELLKYAGTLRIPAKRAQDCIIETARKNGISVQLPSIYDTQVKLTCPTCGTINDDQRYCRTCSTELKIACPSCSQEVLAENGACGKCGFLVGNKAVVQEALKTIKLLITQKNLDDASERLEFASSAWSTSPPKPLKDDLTAQIAEQRRALDHALDERRKRTEEQRKHDDEQRQRTQELRQALDDHRYYEARRLLGQLDPSGKDSMHKAARKEADDAIAWAESEFTNASGRESRGEEVIDQYQVILRRCSDFKAAQDALAKSPPLPADALNATASDGRIVSLTWNASASKNVAYTVVRKPNTHPISAADGEVIAQKVSGTVYDDANPPVGKPVYYAVYTNREGVLATTSAIPAQPVIVTAPVANVRVQVSSGQIHLQWDAPDNVSEIRIYRSESRPRSAADGVQIAVLDRTQAVDRGLDNGKLYYYTLITVFAGHGELPEITGSSVTVEATPDEPPKPITEVHTKIREIRQGEREIHLTWDAPLKGEVIVLQSESKPPVSVGQIIPQDRVTAHGKSLPTQNSRLTVRPPNNARVYLTLLVLFQKQAYIGVTVEYVNLEDVANLTFVREQNAFRLKWNWVANSHKCIVTYRYDDYPNTHDQEGSVRQEITKAQYDQAGGFRINRPEKRNHYIIIYAVIGEGDHPMIASGLSVSAVTCIVVEGLINVDYEVRRIGGLLGRGGRLTLVLTVNGTGTLPAMQLRARQDIQPTRKTEGEVILYIEAIELADDPAKKDAAVSLHYDLSAFQRDRRLVRLFLEDDNLYDHRGGGYVHLEHTSNERVRVF